MPRRKTTHLLIVCLMLGAAAGGWAVSSVGTTAAATDNETVSAAGAALPAFQPIVKENADAVVNISTTRKIDGGDMQIPERFEGTPMEPFFRRFFQGPGPQGERETHSLGSGFIISADGHIVTNAHVVKDATEIVVQLSDRRRLEAEVLGKDMATDVALLKVDAEGLPTVAWSEGEEVDVGEWVLAMGSPFGFEQSATAGIVSAKGRSIPGKAGNYVPFLQTDVAINPGSSGGPLFNLDGEVVGVNAQIFSRSGGYMGLSFAIPSDVAKKVVSQIKETGGVQHGYLGVRLQPMDRKLADSLGLDKPHGGLVADVVSGTPAEEAGLQAGDVILAVDGEKATTTGDVQHLIGSRQPGEAVTLTLLRDGERIEKTVTLGALKTARAEQGGGDDATATVLGMELVPVPSQLRRDRPLPDEGGALVKAIEAGPARSAGIRPGDVILKLGPAPIEGPGDVEERLAAMDADDTVAVLVQRGDRTLFVPLPAS